MSNKTFNDGNSNRHVKNPKTNAQTLQRVLMKAVGLFYAMLKFICNHSFEGVSNGSACMNKFRKVNLKYLRERAATLQDSGQSLYQFYQFMPLQSDKWTPFAAIISQGHLPEVTVGIDAEGGHKAYVNAPSRTYADFVNTWNLQRGDQVTFVTVQKYNGKHEVSSARILLNPRNADGSGAPMTTEIVNSEGEFPCSNWKNRLNFSTFEFDTDHFNFVLGRGGDVGAAGIIVSRKDRSGGWFRSNCQLVLNEAGLGSDLCSLAQAVEKSYAAYEIDMESEFYLNNAGGSSGTGATEDIAPEEPSYATNATINGVSQNIAGGNVTVTAPITSVVVSGTNLSSIEFSAKVDGTGDAISPTSHDANGATFSGLNVSGGHNIVFYHGGTVWFTVTAQADGPSQEG